MTVHKLLVEVRPSRTSLVDVLSGEYKTYSEGPELTDYLKYREEYFHIHEFVQADHTGFTELCKGNVAAIVTCGSGNFRHLWWTTIAIQTESPLFTCPEFTMYYQDYCYIVEALKNGTY